MKRYKTALYCTLIILLVLGAFIYEYAFYRQIPDTLYLQKGKTEEIEFALPVSATLEQPKDSYIETWENRQLEIGNGGIEEKNAYVWKLRLFGLIPLKEVEVKVIDEENVYPIGVPIGIYVKTDGVLVAGMGNIKTPDGNEVCPCENVLQTGDYILAVNDESVSKKGEIIDKIKASEGGREIRR